MTAALALSALAVLVPPSTKPVKASRPLTPYEKDLRRWFREDIKHAVINLHRVNSTRLLRPLNDGDRIDMEDALKVIRLAEKRGFHVPSIRDCLDWQNFA